MREAQERAKKEAEKAEPAEKAEAAEADEGVRGRLRREGHRPEASRSPATTRSNTIVTVTVREKGKTLEEAGGLVMTNDMWLGPQIPQMKEFADFDLKYWKQLQGPQAAALSAEQMSMVLAMFPLVGKAMERMQKEGDKLAGTAARHDDDVRSGLSEDQLAQAKAEQQKPGGGLGGLLAKKMMKKEEPKARATIFTSNHHVLEVAKTVDAADLAIPADFKEKK